MMRMMRMIRVSDRSMQVIEGTAQRQNDHLQAAENQESNNAANPHTSTHKIQQNYITGLKDLSRCPVICYC